MKTEKNIMHIYEFVLYTAHEDKLPGFHRIPKKTCGSRKDLSDYDML